MKNFLHRNCVMLTLLLVSINSFASFNDSFTLTNTTDKYLIIQEAISRQISGSHKTYIVNPNSTKSWMITVNPLKNINEWYYEVTVSVASTAAGSDAVLISVIDQDVEGISFPSASNFSYKVSVESSVQNMDGSLFTTLSVNN